VSYGITKLAIEKYLLLFERIHGIKAVILRLANPYGERQRVETAQGAVAVFLQRALCRRPLEIWGDGSVTRDYVYVGDVADAFLRAAEYEGPMSIFNIGSGEGTSLNDLLVMLENVLGHSIDREYLPARSFDVKLNVLDTRLAQRELKWTPTVAMPEGLVRTAQWTKTSLPRPESA
jgi:UDP-glucose 4-epimerase